MDSISRKAIIIFGPTGVGKSMLADEYAQTFPVEVINMDIGSFYTPLTIGTAKPDWRSSSVKHHLFDILDTPVDFSVVSYRERVEQLVNEIWDRRKIPLLVGGSTLYLKALFFPPAALKNKGIDVGQEEEHASWDILNRIDPKRAQEVHPHDAYRIKRALHLWRMTGKKPSRYRPIYKPLFKNCSLLYITRDRKDLYRRINDRVDSMMRSGLLSEVFEVYQKQEWSMFLRRKKLIGYNDFFPFFASPDTITLASAVNAIKARTRKYAKRQETFWRMLKKELHVATTNHSDSNIQIQETIGR